jgi:hypothetical protein
MLLLKLRISSAYELLSCWEEALAWLRQEFAMLSSWFSPNLIYEECPRASLLTVLKRIWPILCPLVVRSSCFIILALAVKNPSIYPLPVKEFELM